MSAHDDHPGRPRASSCGVGGCSIANPGRWPLAERYTGGLLEALAGHAIAAVAADIKEDESASGRVRIGDATTWSQLHGVVDANEYLIEAWEAHGLDPCNWPDDATFQEEMNASNAVADMVTHWLQMREKATR